MGDTEMGVTSRTTSDGSRKTRVVVVATMLVLTLIGSGCTADGSSTESADSGQSSAPLAPEQDRAEQETSAQEISAEESGSDGEVTASAEPADGKSVVSVAGGSTVASSGAADPTEASTGQAKQTADRTSSSQISTDQTSTDQTSTTQPSTSRTSTTQTSTDQTSTTQASGSSSTVTTSGSTETPTPTSTTAGSGTEGSIVTIAVDPGDPALQGFAWPSDGELGLGFVVLVHPIYETERLHAGQDFRILTGSPVLAARDGTVVSALLAGGYGNLVVLDHGQGVQTMYAHLDEILVAAGDDVTTGQLIARSGSSGTTTGSVLFFRMQIEGNPFDPLLVLPAR